VTNQKKIYIGSDHAGFELKSFIIGKLQENEFTVRDFGTHSEESVNYPNIAHSLSGTLYNNIGILICGSGNGMTMTANKWNRSRAALCWNEEVSRLARSHNDANILCLPARFISFREAWTIVKTFLETPFEGGRHEQRVNLISIFND